MGPDGIHLRVLRELVEVLEEPLSIIYQQSWQTGEVPADWRLANVTPIHKKGRKDDPGNYRPVSLTSVPGKVMEQIILSAIMQCMTDAQVIRPSQHRFMRGRSCLTNLISLYDKVTRLVAEGKAVDVVYLDFSKAFDTVSHRITEFKPLQRYVVGYEYLDGNLQLCHQEMHSERLLHAKTMTVVLSDIQNSGFDGYIVTKRMVYGFGVQISNCLTMHMDHLEYKVDKITMKCRISLVVKYVHVTPSLAEDPNFLIFRLKCVLLTTTMGV
ncbi:rna-directed dna polymerase from mobile element jockey-like [Limosa lapponica baueri]|uniref:Rna-directed dna polymerase from mobile element jockey-like n=1 Tax=Limosa lapponica baueri TaxID=1758121 RepID=A0A2I0URX5_LIMLA|nr:rna-directed dna polymerase from mobile element jockey-like [Limosa lapponica baueri]